MEAILAIIIQYAAIWGPSLVAIFGVIATVVGAINKTRAAIQSFKEDKTLMEVNSKLTTLTAENEELVRCNKLLLDELTKIRNYADNQKRGG